ncbi:hypothetical protein GWI33_000343 [Rhynchophorus ferrugineus]|uniref:Uncharacterized protein n=1 Tax=Rhynchophorus ferrugineus TaxID=354439 RepID=A0A834LYV1_RHYFE|nr:hypothetical protein GWI33_000343 [Rhynchophorus ferrugineus]
MKLILRELLETSKTKALNVLKGRRKKRKYKKYAICKKYNYESHERRECKQVVNEIKGCNRRKSGEEKEVEIRMEEDERRKKMKAKGRT